MPWEQKREKLTKVRESDRMFVEISIRCPIVRKSEVVSFKHWFTISTINSKRIPHWKLWYTNERNAKLTDGGGGQVFECFSYVFVLLFRYILKIFLPAKMRGKRGKQWSLHSANFVTGYLSMQKGSNTITPEGKKRRMSEKSMTLNILAI